MLPAVLSYWRELGALFVTALCTTPDDPEGRGQREVQAPPPEELKALAAAAPQMTGAECLTTAVLESIWDEMAAAFRDERSCP